MKTKIADFLVRTQKATAALLAATTAVASATFLPAPWAAYAAGASLGLTWLLTYVFPYVQKAVEVGDAGHSALEVSSGNEVQVVEDAPVEGEVIEPETVDIPAQHAEPTVSIPVVDGEQTFVPPFTGAVRVEDILKRLDAEAV